MSGTPPEERIVPTVANRRLGDVAVGDRLPTLSYDVTATTVVLGALASRDWRPMHHDYDFAVNRNGTRNIFLNTPNQAAWFERYVTDWSGPKGRLGRMKFRMKDSVYPGDTMHLDAVVEDTGVDEAGCGWATLLVSLTVDGDTKTDCTVRIALPVSRGRQPLDPPRRRLASLNDLLPTHPNGRPRMDLDFTEEQEMLREMVRGVCSSYAPPETVRELEDDPIGYPAELWKQLADLDLIGLMLPTEYGGSGMTALEGAVVYEELGRALAPTPHFVSAVMAAGVLLRAGTDEQKQAWLPKIVTGDAVLTTAWIEPHHGFGPEGVQLQARADGDAFVLDGVKWHVPFARAANAIVVLARTDAGVDLFLVDPTADGVTLGQQKTIASDAQYAVELSGVRVPASARIGAAGSGWDTWHATMLDGIVMLAAQAMGGARFAFDMTVQYAKDRQQFDKPLGAFQAVAHYLADASAAVEGGTILVHEAAWAACQRPLDRHAGADGQAVRVQDVPRRHRRRPPDPRRHGLHRRVRHAALLPPGQGAADLVVERPLPRGADRRRHPRRRRLPARPPLAPRPNSRYSLTLARRDIS